jgi:hypothetical protein
MLDPVRIRGAFEERFCRNATDFVAHATELGDVDAGDAQSGLSSTNGGNIAAWARAEHDHIEPTGTHCASFLTCEPAPLLQHQPEPVSPRSGSVQLFTPPMGPGRVAQNLDAPVACHDCDDKADHEIWPGPAQPPHQGASDENPEVR